MRRRTLAWGICALLALLTGAVVWGSPYAPLAAPAPAQIETVWAIEDARVESETPLVTHLEMDGVPLAYDAQENTFYCTLGLEGEQWPEMRLTAPESDVSLMFVDDYAYDWRTDAVAEGYRYELLTYTDEAFAYCGVVFTGLPVVQIFTEETITQADTQAAFSLSVYGEAALESPARVHLRGDRSLTWKPKVGYKVEFTRGGDSGKVIRRIAGLCDTEDLLLLPLAIDGTMMRDRLSWDIVGMAFDADEGFGGLPNRYVELFVNGGYAGVYLMMPPYDIGGEMRKAGQETVYRDSLYRVTRLEMARERPVLPDPTSPETGFECFYAPSAAHSFDALEDYIGLIAEEDDAAFAEKAKACLDIDSLLRYALIMQLGCMVDNAQNNLYIWAHREDGGYRYRFAFWDMDLTWGLYAGEEGDRWVELDVADRVIALDVDGARARAAAIWAQLKARGVTMETVEALLVQYTHELGDSGAFARDAQRWEKGHFYPDATQILSVASVRFAMMDEWVASLAP